MERNFKYLVSGIYLLLGMVTAVISLTAGIIAIISIPSDTGWWVILDLVGAAIGFSFFFILLYDFGKLIYFGSHLHNKIKLKASDQEIFESVKQEKFIWGCTCEETKHEIEEDP